ncbi:helix-turn-helix domain-containing protein [Chloroflexota bacterium]
MIQLDDFVTPREASRRLGIHEESLRRLLRLGTLNAEKIGQQWFIRRVQLEAFAAAYDPKTGRLRRLL